MNINYNKITTVKLNSIITEERLAELKEIAEIEWNSFTKPYETKFREYTANKASEIAYKSFRHKDKTTVEKGIIASNIVYSDERMARMLNNNNITIETLEAYIRLLNILKIKTLSHTLTEKDQKTVLTVEKLTNKLEKISIKYIGVTDANLIINKINELISFRPELIDTKEESHIRK